VRKINKGKEPAELTTWKRQNPGRGYKDLSPAIRQSIRSRCYNEQHGLCAYCCKRIDEKNCVNEHLVAQHCNPRLSLAFDNIVASCKTPGQCDDAHGTRHLPLTPLMTECETELRFYLSGRVRGLTTRGRETIQILNLDNRALREARKQMLDALIFIQGSSPDELKLLDDDLIEMMLEELERWDEKMRLAAFAPVLINILRQLI